MDSFAFREGTLYLWTGQAPSTEIAYVQNCNVQLTRGILNQQMVNGTYRDVVTGQRADVTFTPVFTPDITLLQLFMQQTGVHMKLDHAHSLGTAGIVLHSGIFDRWNLNGVEGGLYQQTINYHANVWSAYDG